MGAGGPVVTMGMTDGEYIKGDLAMCGVYRRRYFLLRSVTRPEPSTRTTYWSNCRTSTTIPVRSRLVGWGPTRFCSLTQFPMTSGGRTRVCALTVARVPSCVGHVAHPPWLPVFRAKSSVVDTVQVAQE